MTCLPLSPRSDDRVDPDLFAPSGPDPVDRRRSGHPTTRPIDPAAAKTRPERPGGLPPPRAAALLLAIGLGMFLPGPVHAAEIAVGPSPVLNRCSDTTRTLTTGIDGVTDLLGYEVELTLDETVLALPDGAPYGFERGSFLGDSTFFFVEKLAEGSYRITQTKLGLPGVDGTGDLFTLTGDPISETATDMLVSLAAVDARDGTNQAIPVTLGDPAIVRVDCTAPSVGIGEADRSCFRGSGQADPVRAIVGASDEGGIGADLDRIESQLIEGTGECEPAESWSSLIGNLSGTTYGPATEDLPDPAAAGQWTIHLRAVDDAGNASGCAGYTFFYLPDPPPAVTDLAATTLYRAIRLQWTLPALLPGQEIRIVRKHWDNDGTSGYPQYLLNGDLEGGAYPTDLSDGTLVHTTTDGTEFLDETGEVAAEADVYLYRAFVVDCLEAAAGGEAPASISADFSEETTTDAVDAASNYWLGDFDDSIGPPYVQDGYVSVVDLAALSGSMGLLDGEDGFVPEADFGPSAMPTGSPTGVPRPDNQVNFEDLILLAINYGAVEPAVDDPVVLGPSRDSEGNPRLELRTFLAREAGGRVLAAELWLVDHVSGVRGARAVLSYDPAILEPIDSEPAEAVRSRPDAAFAHLFERPGSCDISVVTLGRWRGFAGSGPLFRVTFRVSGTAPPRLTLEGVKLRDLDNHEVGGGGQALQETQGPGERATLREKARPSLEAWPNPFRLTTEIRLQLPHASRVLVTITDIGGRRVRTLTEGRLPAGQHILRWDGTDEEGRPASAGIYYCTLRTDTARFTRKVIYLR